MMHDDSYTRVLEYRYRYCASCTMHMNSAKLAAVFFRKSMTLCTCTARQYAPACTHTRTNMRVDSAVVNEYVVPVYSCIRNDRMHES